MRSSAEGGVGGAAFGDLGFEPVPDCQQLLLVDDVLAAVLEVVLEHVGFDDRVHRARFLAEPAEDALEQVDVVARGAAGAVGALLRNDGDRYSRAGRFAQHAGEAAPFAGGRANASVATRAARGGRRARPPVN